jgi:hypothetical protein
MIVSKEHRLEIYNYLYTRHHEALLLPLLVRQLGLPPVASPLPANKKLFNSIGKRDLVTSTVYTTRPEKKNRTDGRLPAPGYRFGSEVVAGR